MSGWLCSAGVNEVLKAHDVAGDIGSRIIQRVAHPGLSSQMNHDIEGPVRKQRLSGRRVSKIGLDKRDTGVSEQ